MLLPGSRCIINGHGDLAMCREAKSFIGKECVIEKLCKSGLYQISLAENRKMTYSVPKRNIDILGVAVAEQADAQGCGPCK